MAIFVLGYFVLNCPVVVVVVVVSLQSTLMIMIDRGGAGNLWLEGSKVRGYVRRKSPSGVQGRKPVRGLGDEVPQKLKHFLKNRY